MSAATFSRANTDFKVTQRIGRRWNGWRGRGAAAAVATADYAMETQAFSQIRDEFKAARLKALTYTSIVFVTVSPAPLGLRVHKLISG